MKSQTKSGKGFCWIIMGIILLVGQPLETWASVVTFEFTGTVTSVNQTSGFPSSLAGVQPGDPLNGSYSYESSTPPSTNPLSSNPTYGVATYYAVPNTFSLTIKDVSFPIGGSVLSIFIWNDNYPSTSADALKIQNTMNPSQSYYLDFGNLLFPSNTFSSNSLPSASIMNTVVFGIYDSSLSTIYLQGQASSLVVTNTVPIPAAVWLLGSALIGLVGIRRIRK